MGSRRTRFAWKVNVFVLVSALVMAPALETAAMAATIDPAESASTESIAGTVTMPGPYSSDAQVSAVAFAFEAGAWTAIDGSTVATNGAYQIGLPGPGTYRVGFFDSALVYRDAFHLNQSAVTAATDIVVAANANVTGINQTLVENPLNVIEGRIAFKGASGGPIGIELYRHIDVDGQMTWTTVSTGRSNADGTFRVHGGARGEYRIGFVDFEDVFAPIFYPNASTVASATSAAVTTATPVVGNINTTMTVQPSNRIKGSNRFSTAIALSENAFPDSFGGSVVIASGMDFPDALSAGVLAHAVGGPLLLTRADKLPGDVTAEILRLRPSEVIIVGGNRAVSLAQEVTLRRLGVPIVRRLAGTNRYETATQVAQEMVSKGMTGGGALGVFIATGNDFSDALASIFHEPIPAVPEVPNRTLCHDIACVRGVLRAPSGPGEHPGGLLARFRPVLGRVKASPLVIRMRDAGSEAKPVSPRATL